MTSPLIVDCGTCEVRGIACGDCMITALLGSEPTSTVEFTSDEAQAAAALSFNGLVPPLRLVRPTSAPEPPATAVG